MPLVSRWLPWVGRGLFQVPPMDPPQGISECTIKASGTYGKTYLRKGETPDLRERGEDKKVKNSPANTSVKEVGGVQVL